MPHKRFLSSLVSATVAHSALYQLGDTLTRGRLHTHAHTHMDGDTQVLYEESMNTTIAQEMTRFNRLTSVVRKSMQELEKALAGLVVMSSDTENAFNLMAVNQVPNPNPNLTLTLTLALTSWR